MATTKRKQSEPSSDAPDAKVAKPNNVENEGDTTEVAEKRPQCDILICGSTKWSLQVRKELTVGVRKRGGTETGEELLSPHRLRFGDGALIGVSFAAVYSGPLAAHSVLIDTDGNAYGLGRNETSQLGVEGPVAIRVPRKLNPPLDGDEKVVHAACGRTHTILVTSEGRAYAAGENKFGQLGAGRGFEESAQWRRVKLPENERVIYAAAGGNFSMFCTEKGALYSAGCAQYGQLGTGFTGEHIVSAGKIGHSTAYEPKQVRFPENNTIISVTCGDKHTIALDKDGKVWTWGWGAYGRLGHKKTKDELVPRKVDALANMGLKVSMIAAGQQCSYAFIGERNATYKWGINKPNGEATMYPKIIPDLVGWEIRSMAAGPTSTIVAAESSVIAWGNSPCYGELGLGDECPKSSSKPKKCDALEDLTSVQVAMGQCFSIILVDVSNKEDKKIVSELPEVVEFDDQ